MVEMATFTLKTVTGKEAPVTVRTNESCDRTRAYAEVNGLSGEIQGHRLKRWPCMLRRGH